jgi:hypothetical protein
MPHLLLITVFVTSLINIIESGRRKLGRESGLEEKKGRNM